MSYCFVVLPQANVYGQMLFGMDYTTDPVPLIRYAHGDVWGLRQESSDGLVTGMNHSGLCIGAVELYTKSKTKRSGCDAHLLCQKMLEECALASDAAARLISAVEQVPFAQGDFSFLLADRQQALICETYGKNWAIRKVDDLFDMICGEPVALLDAASRFSQASGKQTPIKCADAALCHKYGTQTRRFTGVQFLSNAHFGRPNVTLFGQMLAREPKREKPTGVEVETLLQLFRTHAPAGYQATNAEMLCTHFGKGSDKQTTGSILFLPQAGVILSSGASIACCSLFVPFRINGAGDFSADALRYWLQNEAVRRNIESGHIDRAAYQKELADAQAQMTELTRQMLAQSAAPHLGELNAQAQMLSEAFLARQFSRCGQLERQTPKGMGVLYRRKRRRQNEALAKRL